MTRIITLTQQGQGEGEGLQSHAKWTKCRGPWVRVPAWLCDWGRPSSLSLPSSSCALTLTSIAILLSGNSVKFYFYPFDRSFLNWILIWWVLVFSLFWIPIFVSLLCFSTPILANLGYGLGGLYGVRCIWVNLRYRWSWCKWIGFCYSKKSIEESCQKWNVVHTCGT